ncbi:MAG: putative serine protease PepD [Actinomycetota bacterium]|jgi:putative serine protease PepD|nr:putative serine protease PepD [Actinomycetota bacterium]
MTDDTRTIAAYEPSGHAGDADPFAPAQPTPTPGPATTYADTGDPWLPPAPPPQPDPDPDPARRRGRTALVALALAAGLVGGGVGAGVTAATRNDPTPAVTSLATPARPARGGTTAVEQVASRLLPSVVSIVETTADGGGEGTGVVLSSDGLILTNNHVVAGAAQGGSLSVTLNDGRTVDATIVGRDPVTDLAVVRAKGAHGLTPAELGSSASLRPGQAVVAIGSPLGLQGTVTSGIVSALDRPVRTGGEAGSGDPTSTVIDAIQTDAAINPGNSGGPLVNLSGQVVGINSAIASLGAASGTQSGSIGVGFSIPIDQARLIAKQLIASGTATHAQLGVSVRDAAGSNASSTVGAFLAAVAPGGAAHAGGLRQGDVITKVGNRRIDDADALIAAIRSHRSGDQVSLTYVSGGRTQQATVTLGNDAPST